MTNVPDRADSFDPTDPNTWIGRGRTPDHAAALAQAWRDFPDHEPHAPLDARMARSRERVAAMRPVNDAIRAHTEAQRQADNFGFLERKASAGQIDDSDLAVLSARDSYAYDWDRAVQYSRGWYAAHAGWEYRPCLDGRAGGVHALKAAYDRGFEDGGGDRSDLFDAARRRNAAALRTGNLPPVVGAAPPSRPLPSQWPLPSDEPRPARWARRLLIVSAEQGAAEGLGSFRVRDELSRFPGADAMTVVLVTASSGFAALLGQWSPEPLSPTRASELAGEPEQIRRLQELIGGRDFDDVLVAADGEYLRIIDAAASVLPLCRTMERTRNTPLQQRAHLRTWLGRGFSGDLNIGAGHIRWSKVTKGLTGKLGEFTARYAGRAEGGGHLIVIETAPGTLAAGFVRADGSPLDPTIAFSNKAKLREAMAAALRAFGGATPSYGSLLAA
ncbi:hypothetical protein [Sphingomonas sp. TZW2008]|uniref:hypothetical protein n=1 Tax=Sphingomonas sp. TZW2008 TaxID=1917973 RepID=UPI000A27163C|nr:hypothetical protein [Sphingomonas sp. TZW2008]